MFWQKLFATIVCAGVGAVLYRMGGASGYNTKVRDLGIPSVATLLLLYLNNWQHSLIWAICLFFHFGFLFGSLTTYFKKDGEPAKWWNWILVGLACSISALPIALYTGHFPGFIYRTVYLTIGVLLCSELISNVVVEELSRGFLIIATLPFLI